MRISSFVLSAPPFSSPFLRSSALRTCRARAFKPSTASSPRVSATMRVDAHVHVWSPDFPTHPDHPLPALPGAAEDLVALMDGAGVDTAVIVQPINYMFDHSYVRAAVARYPTRFRAVALADTRKPPVAAAAAVRALHDDGFVGLRVNPNFTGGTFESETVKATVAAAGELGMPVCLFSRPPQWDSVLWLVDACPGATIVLDHFGFAAEEEQQDKVVELMQEKNNVLVKTSAWFRVSKSAFPHEDLTLFVKRLVENVGADRLLFGSDFPFVAGEYPYANAVASLDGKVPESAAVQEILGGTAARIYGLQ